MIKRNDIEKTDVITRMMLWMESRLGNAKGEQMYVYFFRCYQVLQILSMIFALALMLQVSSMLQVFSSSSEHYYSILSSLVLFGFSVLLSEIGLRSIQYKKPLGLLIGFIQIALWIFTPWFLVSVFGIYAFINSDFLSKNKDWLPKPYLEFLGRGI